jgi:hypothetical protein
MIDVDTFFLNDSIVTRSAILAIIFRKPFLYMNCNVPRRCICREKDVKLSPFPDFRFDCKQTDVFITAER